MKIKSLLSTALTIIFITGLNSCSQLGDDRESKVRASLEQKVSSQSNGIIKLDDFRKTNGYDQNMMGMQVYVLEWQADISTQQEVWKAGNAFEGYWQRFEVMTSKPGGWDAFLAGEPKHYGVGANIRLTGTSKLQKTEEGWRVEELTVKTSQTLSQGSVTSNSTNPKPNISSDNSNLIQFIGTWSAYGTGYGAGNQKIIDKEPSLTFDISTINGKIKVRVCRIGSTVGDFYYCEFKDGKLCCAGFAADRFYKYQIPSFVSAQNGELLYSDGGGDFILKRSSTNIDNVEFTMINPVNED